ncbi:MAG: hypothetical protein KatS3mg105_0995 [Gemmatales bacterium]|nr:MAG: hypothetical protein KatS3mg105_0995 [Gemmatales bacterium]
MRILFASPNHWFSPFQVGSHHLARRFVAAGWRAAYVSDPISPWHFLKGVSKDLRDRWRVFRQGGIEDLDGRLWTYVPAACLTPHRYWIVRSRWVHRHWYQLTWPNVVTKARQAGFGSVDLLYLDSLHQSFWLDTLDYRRSVFRLADYSPKHPKVTNATRDFERKMAQRVDLVVYPSPRLRGYAESLRPKRLLYVPNGVDFGHFARGDWPVPMEYRQLDGPIAVYVGVMPRWFHFDWVREAAKQLPAFSFVLIGPDQLARREFAGMRNVHCLGFRDYSIVPAYLHHADVGLMPFNVAVDANAVEALNPQKLYAYLAAGLPVVAADWETLRELQSPVRRCRTAGEFAQAIADAAAHPGDCEARRWFASRFDWRFRMEQMLAELGFAARQPAA